VGGLGRYTDRAADNRAWSVQSLNLNPLTEDRSLRELPPEQIFGEAFTNPEDDVFTVVSIAQGGSYAAREYVGAGYAMAEWAITPRLQLVTGARVEHSRLDLEAIATDRKQYGANPSYTDVLPSLTLNFAANGNHNLRFSVSRTLARPEYREVAPIQYREVIGGENTRGNADLRRTLIQNVDLRWEFYPAPDEVLSVGVFAKRFQDPIERIYLASSGTALTTFVNAAGAENYGVELEVRKGLGALGTMLDPITVFSNVTLMRSDIRIGNDGLASTTNPERAMIGQAPYVINGGLTYTRAEIGTSATVLYNRVGKRIVAAAGFPLPDVYELPRPSLDLSLQFPLFANLSGKIDAKNLLDSPHQVEQGEVVREYYRSGRAFSVGVALRR
jgi:TonB-dependent receptor